MRNLFCIGLLLLMAQPALAKEKCSDEMRGDAFYAAIAFLAEVPSADERAFEERSRIAAKANLDWAYKKCDSYFALRDRIKAATVAQKSPN